MIKTPKKEEKVPTAARNTLSKLLHYETTIENNFSYFQLSPSFDSSSKDQWCTKVRLHAIMKCLNKACFAIIAYNVSIDRAFISFICFLQSMQSHENSQEVALI